MKKKAIVITAVICILLVLFAPHVIAQYRTRAFLLDNADTDAEAVIGAVLKEYGDGYVVTKYTEKTAELYIFRSSDEKGGGANGADFHVFTKNGDSWRWDSCRKSWSDGGDGSVEVEWAYWWQPLKGMFG